MGRQLPTVNLGVINAKGEDSMFLVKSLYIYLSFDFSTPLPTELNNPKKKSHTTKKHHMNKEKK